MKAKPQRLGPDLEQYQPGAQSDQTKGEVREPGPEGFKVKATPVPRIPPY